ncbi:hypothetical protein EPL64_16655 [Clostridioides difficile]|uniref:hypothetical protein n=1 Tax=Clostridioides difficile TaxID=1496 RepID=UPI0006BBB1D1|nr:hypothetical protein [Clostridioides difficile]OFU31335.1 hypothetical protein HMPREF3075_09075 [Clostridium sp. HMSC19B11]EGT4206191.1 hypothetical protein [Clostridioides difficile]EIS9525867.1 hypothetical protein [Clostridioides difficile]EIS9627334.1 hypothetical protein [Clostridioides difficile]KPI46576.1 hypothetical protein KW95_18475 [Clostridioides difficile]
MYHFESLSNYCSVIDRQVSTDSKYFETHTSNDKKLIDFSCSHSNTCNLSDENKCELLQKAHNKYR